MERINSETEYPSEGTLGDQGLRGSGEQQKLPIESPGSLISFHDRISQLAYLFYLRRGQMPGRDLDDWLAAERILLSPPRNAKEQPGDQADGK